MCGRYALALSNEELYDGLQNRLPQLFRLRGGGNDDSGNDDDGGRPRWERPQDHRASYNIAPRQRASVIRRDNETGEAIIEEMQWGLIPHWTKHPPTGGLNTINARSEALIDNSSGGMWHALKGYKRCIVPAQGYYEWQKKSPSSKVAHFTRLPLGEKSNNTNSNPPLMFFAGLYDIVKYLSPVESRFQPRDGDGREPYPTGNPLPLATFTILTTTPAKDLDWLHDRMPCILNDWEDIERWLDLGEMKGWEDGKNGTGTLLTSFPGLDSFPVPPEVGKIGTNSPTYIEPVSQRSDGIKSFFQKQITSPAKPSSKTAKPSVKQESSDDKAKVKSETKVKDEKPQVNAEESKSSIKSQVEGMKTEIRGEEEVGIGDDSNAPNPAESEDQKPALKDDEDKSDSPKKRKRNEPDSAEQGGDDGNGDKGSKATGDRKGGHQTKVVRRTSEDDNKGQSSIDAFFKSPSKTANAESTAKTKTRTTGKRGTK